MFLDKLDNYGRKTVGKVKKGFSTLESKISNSQTKRNKHTTSRKKRLLKKNDYLDRKIKEYRSGLNKKRNEQRIEKKIIQKRKRLANLKKQVRKGSATEIIGGIFGATKKVPKTIRKSQARSKRQQKNFMNFEI